MNNHKGGLIAAVGKAMRTAEASYKHANPEAQTLKVRAALGAYKPRPRELRDVRVRAVKLFLGSAIYVNMSNAAVAAYLTREVAGYDTPSNLLTELFTPTEKQAVVNLFKEFGRPPLDLQRNDTPSKVKLALRARYRGENARKVQVTATFSPGVVTINDRTFPVTTTSGLGRIRVGKHWVNLAVLQLLLDPV